MIRESLEVWKTKTELLIRLLDVREEEKRDRVIEQVDKLLMEREALQSSIQAPFMDEEMEFGKGLLLLEEELRGKLSTYMKDIRIAISDQQKKKVSVHAYMDPYSNVYRDGTFYDKKK